MLTLVKWVAGSWSWVVMAGVWQAWVPLSLCTSSTMTTRRRSRTASLSRRSTRLDVPTTSLWRRWTPPFRHTVGQSVSCPPYDWPLRSTISPHSRSLGFMFTLLVSDGWPSCPTVPPISQWVSCLPYWYHTANLPAVQSHSCQKKNKVRWVVLPGWISAFSSSQCFDTVCQTLHVAQLGVTA